MAKSIDAMILYWDAVDNYLWRGFGVGLQSLGLSRGYENMMPHVQARAVQYLALDENLMNTIHQADESKEEATLMMDCMCGVFWGE